MSQIKGITKTNTKVVYTLTKDNEFLKQMTEVLIRLGLHENIPTGFPIHQEADEECIDIMRKEEFYHAVHGNNIDITIVYGTTRLFIIATGTEEHIEECNKYMSDYFSF